MLFYQRVCYICDVMMTLPNIFKSFICLFLSLSFLLPTLLYSTASGNINAKYNSKYTSVTKKTPTPLDTPIQLPYKEIEKEENAESNNENSKDERFKANLLLYLICHSSISLKHTSKAYYNNSLSYFLKVRKNSTPLYITNRVLLI